MNEALNIAWEHRSRWRFIGIELGIDLATLDAISADEKKVDDCLTEVIKQWLRKEKPRPTQQALESALQSERVSGAQ